MAKPFLSLVFSVVLFLLFCWSAWKAAGFSELAKFFPYYISIAAAILAFIHVLIGLKTYLVNKQRGHIPEAVGDGDPEENTAPVWRYMVWIIGYIVFIYLIGFLSATVLFLIVFLYFETKFSMIKTAISVVITLSLILIFSKYMTLYWPKGILPLWPF